MKLDIIDMLERLATYGTAPAAGCSVLGVGYEEAFARLQRKYLEGGFRRGKSAEKFVIGPYGSGKTHFVRQLSEIAREQGCASAEVSLNKKLDFTQSLVVYREVAKAITAPGRERGIQALVEACADRVRTSSPLVGLSANPLEDWLILLGRFDFELASFRRVAVRAFTALLRDDQLTLATACRWLAGDADNREVAKSLDEVPLARGEADLFGSRALFCLGQLVHLAGFPGTVIAFDEADQGFDVDARKLNRIASLLRTNLDALADLRQASMLVVYALTPYMIERVKELYPALQDRIADPDGVGFFAGQTLAPTIDLTRRTDPEADLRAIATRLVELLYREEGEHQAVPMTDTLALAHQIAREVAESDISVSSRRMLAKNVAAVLCHLYETGRLERTPARPTPEELEEAEV